MLVGQHILNLHAMSQPMVTLYDVPSNIPQPWVPNIWRIRSAHPYLPVSEFVHHYFQANSELQTHPIPYLLGRVPRYRANPACYQRTTHLHPP